MRYLFFGFVLSFASIVGLSDDKAPSTENGWVKFIAKDAIASGKMDSEVTLFNRKRVDLLSRSHAVECDWAYKWSEGVGQSLYYAAVTHRKAGLLLLLRNDDDLRYVDQALVVTRRNDPPIDVLVYDCRKQDFVFVAARSLGHFMED